MSKNKGTLGFIIGLAMLVGIVIGSLTINQANATATLADTLNFGQNATYTFPVAINWQKSTDTTFLMTLPTTFGYPIGYKHIQFQDQDDPDVGNAGTGTGGTAQELQQTFTILEGLGVGASVAANQITVYNQEFDGTVPTQDSVISYGEFIFTQFDFFKPTL